MIRRQSTEGLDGLIRLPRSLWEATLYAGVVTQLVVSLFLLTADYSRMPAPVVRDIYIVAICTLIAVMTTAMLIPAAATHVVARRILFGAIVVALLVSVFGAAAQAVTPWAVVPSLILVLGALLLFRRVKLEGAE